MSEKIAAFKSAQGQSQYLAAYYPIQITFNRFRKQAVIGVSKRGHAPWSPA
jgi:hypothetical protein